MAIYLIVPKDCEDGVCERHIQTNSERVLAGLRKKNHVLKVDSIPQAMRNRLTEDGCLRKIKVDMAAVRAGRWDQARHLAEERVELEEFTVRCRSQGRQSRLLERVRDAVKRRRGQRPGRSER